jgi:hypothetical protein
MKYAVEMGPGAMKYITKLRKVWFRHSEINSEGIHKHTDSMVIA